MYPGIALSEDRVAYLTAEPTTQAIANFVRRKFSNLMFDGKPAQMTLDRLDGGHVRFRIEGIKGVVITAHDYWEYLGVSVS